WRSRALARATPQQASRAPSARTDPEISRACGSAWARAAAARDFHAIPVEFPLLTRLGCACYVSSTTVSLAGGTFWGERPIREWSRRGAGDEERPFLASAVKTPNSFRRRSRFKEPLIRFDRRLFMVCRKYAAPDKATGMGSGKRLMNPLIS